MYVVQTRAKGKSKRVTLGRHGVISADQARRKAAETIARIKSGEDPEGKPASTVTVADVAARYLKEHVALHCKPGTAKLYRSVVKRFILPAYGHLAVEEVEREHIANLHYELRDMPYQANRVLEIGEQAVQPRRAVEAPHGQQPVQVRAQVPGEEARAVPHRRGVSPSRRRPERMEADKTLPVYRRRAFRLLMLTGCRRNEIVTLRWEHVDLDDGELTCPTARLARAWCRCHRLRRGS